MTGASCRCGGGSGGPSGLRAGRRLLDDGHSGLLDERQRSLQGEPDDERGAHPHRRLHADGAAVRVDERPSDREAQPAALDGALAGRGGAEEPFERVREALQETVRMGALS